MESLASANSVVEWLTGSYLVLKVVIGFSLIIFVHELGHFLAAKWMGVRVDRFAVGFFYRLCGYRRGEGITFGPRPNYKPDELAAKGYGETDYCLNALPFGGYVKMMGEDDILINEETGEMKRTDDPRAFANKPVGRRMTVVSAGVVFNLLFAVLLYAVVFLFLGQQVIAPVIGRVTPDSAAANAGFLPGDRVLAVNGHPITSFDDIVHARLLAEAPLHLTVQRGQRTLDKTLSSERSDRSSLDWLRDIAPVMSTRISPDLPASKDGPHPGDEIIAVNDQPVSGGLELVRMLQQGNGAALKFTARRSDPTNPAAMQTVSFMRPAALKLAPKDPETEGLQASDSESLLGFRRRRTVVLTEKNRPGARAGLQPGDVIAQWGSVANPLGGDIVESIQASQGRAIPVVVERDGKLLPLEVTPEPRHALFGGTLFVGVSFGAENAPSIVADLSPNSPAAALGMPRGAEILAVGGRPTPTWIDVFLALRAAAGSTVDVRYRAGDDEIVGHMPVPSSVVNELELPLTAQIVSINGQDSIALGKTGKLSLPATLAIQKLLEQNVDRTVEVEYLPDLLDVQTVKKPFRVRSDNTDPWQLRAQFGYDLFLEVQPLQEPITAGGNPLRALEMGLARTGYELGTVYRVFKTLVKNTLTQTGNVGVQDVSGPIGIVRAAMQRAEAGWGDLLFFLAFISVNLAVINFLPLPVVDGGLMVFLLLEKVRRRPLSLKVQIVTTLAGLGLIILCFLLVTFQDIAKWVSGSM